METATVAGTVATSAAASPAAGATRLWMLEDDGELAQLLCIQCRAQGWNLEVFDTPRTFEAALEQQTPDLVLLDQLLPERMGSEILQSLRLRGHTFPVLMLSALGAPSDRITGLEAGADDYLGKPFLFRELQLRIERLLQSRQVGPIVTPEPRRGYRIGKARFDPHRLTIGGADGSEAHISRGDSALLLALCRRPGDVVSRRTLAGATGSLVDTEHSRSIDVRLSRIRRLLASFQPGPERIQSVRGHGYRLDGPVEPLQLHE